MIQHNESVMSVSILDVIIYCKGMQDELAQNDITMMSAAMTISLIIHKISLHLAA